MRSDILLQAARVAHPWGSAASDALPAGEGYELARVLEQNKVPLLALKRKYGERVDASALGVYAGREEKLFARLRGEFERVRGNFEREGIQTLFLKSTGLYPSFPHLSSNLDVMVMPERGDDARKLLCELGYVELVNTEEPGKFLFRRFAGDGFSYTFHLHETAGWGVPFVDTGEIWAGACSAEDDPSIVVPGPREALLITLAHWFYEDKELSLWNLFLTAHAARSLDRKLTAAADGAAAKGWGAGFFAAVKVFNEAWIRMFGEDFLERQGLAVAKEHLKRQRFVRSYFLGQVRYMESFPARLPFIASKVVYYQKVSTDPSRPAGEKACDWLKTLLWAVRWKLHIRSQKRLLIGLSGCDGSGKTLQAVKLHEALSSCDIRSKVIWARGGSSPFVSFFTGFAKKLKVAAGDRSAVQARGANEAERVRLRRNALSNPFLNFLYALLYSLDLCWIYLFKIRLYLLSGNVVVCDRYVTDAAVDFAVSSGRSLGRLPLPVRALARLAPSPDISFLLDVEEEEALKRKPEEGSTTHLAAARKMFSEAAGKSGWHIIDSSLGAGEAHELIARTSLRLLFERYGTWVNALLYSNPSQVNPGRWRPRK